MPGENSTIKATWKINQYTISFDSKGGSSVSSIRQDYGTIVNAPTSPIYTGYTFNYWYLKKSNTSYIFSTMPAKNLTLSADWTIHRHDVKFIVMAKNIALIDIISMILLFYQHFQKLVTHMIYGTLTIHLPAKFQPLQCLMKISFYMVDHQLIVTT
jgi:uncharacterized repeat protein (TIGR02543 family)